MTRAVHIPTGKALLKPRPAAVNHAVHMSPGNARCWGVAVGRARGGGLAPGCSRRNSPLALAIIAIAAAGCDDLQGFTGEPPPLATIRAQLTGDFADVAVPGDPPPTLRGALVWGAQWLTEPLCIVPIADADAAAVVAAGCRDPFGFVPARIAAEAPLGDDGAVALTLDELPGADVLVGSLTGRVGYASLVVYDDRDRDGVLTLLDESFRRDMTTDRIYAASFVSMTEPDTRIAFREGSFDRSAAFYPRSGCGDPPTGFALLSAGGFTAAEAFAAQARGELPAEDPATCRESAVIDDAAPIELALRPPAELAELACREHRFDSSVYYDEPIAEISGPPPGRRACVPIPDFGTGATAGLLQLVVAQPADAPCRLLRHFILRGCHNNPLCASPDWDHSAAPPAWWPCPVPPTP